MCYLPSVHRRHHTLRRSADYDLAGSGDKSKFGCPANRRGRGPQAGENGTPNALARSSAICGPTRSGAASTAAGWLGASARLPQHSEAQRGRLPIFARASGLLAAMFPVVEPVSPSVSSRPTSPCSSATWSWPHESPQRTLALLPYRQSPRAEPSSRSLSVPATQRHAPCSRDARLDR